jgi:hypothetical protein
MNSLNYSKMKNDYQTSTLDGAAGFERMYGEYEDDTPTLNELMREDYSEDYEDTDDECNCSDPGCPCRGIKYGGL